jgi:hypothetical protein
MDLEVLRRRRAELENSSIQIANSWNTVQGHKNEIDHWIGELEKKSLDSECIKESYTE